MAEEKTELNRSKVNRKIWMYGSIGVIIGFVLCAIVMISAMPSMMIVTRERRMGLDETVAALEKRIPEHGWVVSGGKAMNMNDSLAKNGADFKPGIRIVKLCNAEYAKSILTTDRNVSCMMPCTMSVWEDNDGKVYLSKMNMSLVAKMFGGNIGKIMGGKVVQDEEKVLEGLLR